MSLLKALFVYSSANRAIVPSQGEGSALQVNCPTEITGACLPTSHTAMLWAARTVGHHGPRQVTRALQTTSEQTQDSAPSRAWRAAASLLAKPLGRRSRQLELKQNSKATHFTTEAASHRGHWALETCLV